MTYEDPKKAGRYADALRLVGLEPVLKKMMARLSAKSIAVSLFIDPDTAQIQCAKSLGADMIELHTGAYASAQGKARDKELIKLLKASELAGKLKVRLHAGHGLDYKNVQPIARLPGMEELNIGFSIVARAVFVGLAAAVGEMKELILCAE